MTDFIDDLALTPGPKHVRPVKQPVLKKTKDRLMRDAVKQIVGAAVEGDEKDLKALAKMAGRPEVSLLKEAFTNFEGAVGGRQALIEVLVHCPPGSIGGNLIGKLTADPDFVSSNAYALHILCRKHKIPFNAVVQAFRDAKLAKIAIETLNQVSDRVPEVVEQLVLDATNRWEACTVCDGSGRITRINEQGEFAFDSEGSPLTQLCFDCRGKGQKYVRHDFSNRSKVLDLAGLRPDKGPLVQQTFNQQATLNGIGGNTSFIPGDGSFESLMRAVELTLKPILPDATEGAEAILDAEIIVYDPPVQDSTPEAQGQAEGPAESLPEGDDPL